MLSVGALAVWLGVTGLASAPPPPPPAGPEVPREPASLLAASIPVATPLDGYSDVELHGFPVLVDPALAADRQLWRRTRAALLFDLGLVAERLPGAALEGVRRTPIVVTRSTPPRPDWDGGSAACLHVSEGWLVAHGYDAARAGVVEILHAEKYLLWRAEQPMMLLHELAHAHHLALGYDEPRIASAFEAAVEAGLYEAVPYVMAPDAPGRRAYAATNPQEYFAELTEAYFGRNDYYPFTREDLRAHDPEGFVVVQSVWGVEPTP